jgi:D-aspartate ligase
MKNAHVYNQAPAVVINAGNSNGYGVIINLGREGVPVLSVDSNPHNLTFYSKYARRILSPDPRVSEDGYIKFLLDFGKSLTPKPVLFVTGDEMLLTILEHREKLEPHFHMPMASLNVASKLLIKKEFYRMLDHFGVPHAKTYSPDGPASINDMCEDLDYPCILKPSRSNNFSIRFHNKCLRVDSSEKFMECFAAVASEYKEIILQQELLGTERYLVYTYFDSSSRPLAVNCYKKIRIFPIDYGNACVCQTLWESAAVEMTLNILKILNYHGLAEAEVQRDARDGQLKLVEINARSTTETRLSARCGMNMEYIAYRDALGMPIGEISPARDGVKWFDIITDIQSIFFPKGYLSQGQISVGQWLRSYRGEREYAFWAWDDPLPFTILLFRFLLALGRKIIKKFLSPHAFRQIIGNGHKA